MMDCLKLPAGDGHDATNCNFFSYCERIEKEDMSSDETVRCFLQSDRLFSTIDSYTIVHKVQEHYMAPTNKINLHNIDEYCRQINIVYMVNNAEFLTLGPFPHKIFIKLFLKGLQPKRDDLLSK